MQTTRAKNTWQSVHYEYTADDLPEICMMRTAFYGMMRQFYMEEPQQAYLSLCREHKVFENVPYSLSSSKIRQGIELIEEYGALENPIDDNGAFNTLHWDYTKLFIGPLPPTAPPWASFYLEKDKLLFQRITLGVRERYHRHNLMAGTHINEQADDHVGLEFAFLEHLSGKCLGECREAGYSESARALFREQQDFIVDHLLSYFPSFCQAVQDHAELGFYKGITLIAWGYLEEDVLFLADILKAQN